MSRTIFLSEETYNRLEALAIPFEDKSPEDVIVRLLDAMMTKQGIPITPMRAQPERAPNVLDERVATVNLPGREPRERGATITIANQTIRAVSVPDLYTKAMRWLLDEGHMQKLDALIPFQTSQQRYLIAKKPVHPQGNNFVSPVKYGGYYMEAHKNYQNAVSSLRKFLAKVGIDVKYVA